MVVSSQGAAMTKNKSVRWGRWVAAVTGVLVTLKASVFVFSRVFRVAKHEVQARGGDVTFVLGLNDRRRNAR
jgi:hypothetical protein